VHLKAGLEAVYEQVETDLVARLENPSRARPEPATLNIAGLKVVRSQPEIDVAIAISFLRNHLDSADEDEVQRLMPMLQYLEQKALERAAQLHPPDMP
jgi:hypothetical protein